MTETIIHLDGAKPLAVLDERGWAQGAWTDGAGHVCAHQAIRLCSPQPGDAYLIEQVADRLWGRGTGWNDNNATTVSDVREWLGAGIDVTDADMAETFGPQWRAVVEIVRRAAVLTDDEARRLAVVWAAARAAARDAAWAAAWAAARAAAWDAAWDAAGAAVTWDLATADGPYTHAHRDLLMAPWVEVCGLPEGLIDTLGDDALTEAVARAIAADPDFDRRGEIYQEGQRLRAKRAMSVPGIADALARDAAVAEIVAGYAKPELEARNSYDARLYRRLAALYPEAGK